MSVCAYCGNGSEDGVFTFCSFRREYVHTRCERLCENYSSEMLPNGTNCRKKYSEDLFFFKALGWKVVPVSPAKVRKEKEKYCEYKTGDLRKRFVSLAARYKAINNPELRAAWRPELAAMQNVLIERINTDVKMKSLHERFIALKLCKVPQETTNNKELENEFNDVWKLYPRKEGKERAKKAYISARKSGTKRAEIEDGIRRYIKQIEVTKTLVEYIKHGGTWFHNKCWQDEYRDKAEKESFAAYDIEVFEKMLDED